MRNSVLELHLVKDMVYQTVFTNNHGRKIYLQLLFGNNCEVLKCFYVDRAERTAPKLFQTTKFTVSEILDIISKELDKTFKSFELKDNIPLSMEEFIKQAISKRKYKFLILLKEGHTLKTIFKNRFRREIYLEIDTSGEKALIKTCKYYDTRGANTDITPYNLKTIFFNYNFATLLQIVNNELEGGFSDIIITENHTVKLDRAICGSI